MPCWNRLHQGIRLAGVDLIGTHLVGHVHDEVAIHHGVDKAAEEGDGQVEPRVLLQAEADGDDRNVAHSGLFQRLAEQVDVVGGTAAAAGLGDEQRYLVWVIAPVLDGVQELADDQQGGVAGVVVDVLQPFVHHCLPLIVQLHHIVAFQLKHLLEHPEVDGEHLGHQDGVFFLHLLGEQETTSLVIY